MSAHAEQNNRVLDQFAKQAERYAALIANVPDPSLAIILETMRPGPNERLLDVGCGAGNFAVTIAPVVAEVVGVDLTPAMLDQARARQVAAKAENIVWREADVTALPFEDGAFDIVTSRAMLHHVREPAKVIAEMRRVCAPGGRMMVLDMTPAPEKAAALNAIEILRDPSHARALTASELRTMGADLGLVELGFHQRAARAPLEAVLATSFPGPDMLDRVRELYRSDAETGGDSLGMGARFEDGAITIGYPMSLLMWRRPQAPPQKERAPFGALLSEPEGGP